MHSSFNEVYGALITIFFNKMCLRVKMYLKFSFNPNLADLPFFPPLFLVLDCTFFNCFSATDLANLVNVAASKAAVEGAEKLSASQLEFAKDRIIMGTERKTM